MTSQLPRGRKIALFFQSIGNFHCGKFNEGSYSPIKPIKVNIALVYITQSQNILGLNTQRASLFYDNLVHKN